jgi:hypothetical protein
MPGSSQAGIPDGERPRIENGQNAAIFPNAMSFAEARPLAYCYLDTP